jgi:hypothetical protein
MRPSIVGFLLHRMGFNPRLVHMGFVKYTLAQEEIVLIVPSVILLVPHTGMSQVNVAESHFQWQ